MTSATDLNGALAWTASTRGASLTIATGARSRSTSYGMSLNIAGLIATSPTVTMVSVYPSGAGSHRDEAVAARLVFHHHLLSPSFGQLGADDARGDVGDAARRVRHQDVDRLVRIILRLRCPRPEQGESGDQKTNKRSHWSL